jgi:hypothetical protein
MAATALTTSTTRAPLECHRQERQRVAPPQVEGQDTRGPTDVPEGAPRVQVSERDQQFHRRGRSLTTVLPPSPSRSQAPDPGRPNHAEDEGRRPAVPLRRLSQPNEVANFSPDKTHFPVQAARCHARWHPRRL